MRYPAVAGAFYERSRDGLLRQIRESYTHPLGPGRVPAVMKGGRRLIGLVVPHAGYMYSGPVAAHSYAELAEDGWPGSFVILGPNHHGQGAPLALTNHEWQTPLGTVPIDTELHEALAK
ncbi:MAG TPA: AmmeMemoRadiSam system protein B, partial [Thermoplasmata archaeon]|nr:AmmeMemoRadiSam system protein B [Thermoplasmata archaeon]